MFFFVTNTNYLNIINNFFKHFIVGKTKELIDMLFKWHMSSGNRTEKTCVHILLRKLVKKNKVA